MTDIQANCETPGRTVIGHPFNPVYLLPLVEIVGGERTDPEAVVWAGHFYRLAGKAPLLMKKEIPGFVATRLQEALWREALHMVANGEATPEDIDIALMPIGAYEPPSGRDVHMNPEEALTAFEELGARLMVPMHYGTFPLGSEPMHEPLERLRIAASRRGLTERVHVLDEGFPRVF